VLQGENDVRRAELVYTLQGFLDPIRSHDSTVVPLRGAPAGALGASPVRLRGFEQRSEMARRFQSLDPRERLVLFRSCVEQIPVAHIAAELGISARYCYKLRNRALDALSDDASENEAAS